MNRETEKEARAQTGAGPQITDLRAKVPAMEDAALTNLRANATRLLAEGSAKQKAAAGELLPVVEAELAARKEAKRLATPVKVVRTKKTKVAKEADEEAAAD